MARLAWSLSSISCEEAEPRGASQAAGTQPRSFRTGLSLRPKLLCLCRLSNCMAVPEGLWGGTSSQLLLEV